MLSSPLGCVRLFLYAGLCCARGEMIRRVASLKVYRGRGWVQNNMDIVDNIGRQLSQHFFDYEQLRSEVFCVRKTHIVLTCTTALILTTRLYDAHVSVN
jgi:hypothetical protein